MKSHFFRSFFFMLLAAGLLMMSPAAAFTAEFEDNAIGKVIAVRGKVTARLPDESPRPLKIKAPIYLHDMVETQNGRIQMMFQDNTLITLGKNSQLEINRYLWEPGSKASEMTTSVNEGSFRIMGGAITRTAPDHFKTISPSGTIGIRGSMYAGMVRMEQLSVVFQGGRGIYVTNPAGMVTITRPGFITHVKSLSEPPQKPEKANPLQLQELERDLAFSEPEETAELSGDLQADDTLQIVESSWTAGAALPDEGPAEDDTDPLSAPPIGDNPGPLDDDPLLPDSPEGPLYPDTTLGKIQLLMASLGGPVTQSGATLPTSGVWLYKGKSQNLLENGSEGAMKFIVNWHNGRIFGFEDGTSSGAAKGIGFGYGSMLSTGEIDGLTVLGSDSTADSIPQIIALTGSETFGWMFGSSFEGLGLAMEGYDYNVKDQSQQTFWSDIAAAVLNSQMSNSTGTETWEGFFTGTAENMNDPINTRRIFYNKTPNTNSKDRFTLSVDKDSGTITGSLGGEDFNDAANEIDNLTVGGSTADSVYISDQILAAKLSGGTPIDINGPTASLKTHGNFMVTADQGMLSANTTWGYWEIAYTDPVSSQPYHLHVPSSLWIAGNRTASSSVAALSLTSAVYTGKATGVVYDASSTMTQLNDGTTSIEINFNTDQLVSGSISFSGEPALPLTPGTITDYGFNTTISTATQSAVNGAFYGTNAQGIGGNFNARMSDGKHYSGIFAGDRP